MTDILKNITMLSNFNQQPNQQNQPNQPNQQPIVSIPQVQQTNQQNQPLNQPPIINTGQNQPLNQPPLVNTGQIQQPNQMPSFQPNQIPQNPLIQIPSVNTQQNTQQTQQPQQTQFQPPQMNQFQTYQPPQMGQQPQMNQFQPPQMGQQNSFQQFTQFQQPPFQQHQQTGVSLNSISNVPPKTFPTGFGGQIDQRAPFTPPKSTLPGRSQKLVIVTYSKVDKQFYEEYANILYPQIAADVIVDKWRAEVFTYGSDSLLVSEKPTVGKFTKAAYGHFVASGFGTMGSAVSKFMQSVIGNSNITQFKYETTVSSGDFTQMTFSLFY